jgi:hypothetical protein
MFPVLTSFCPLLTSACECSTSLYQSLIVLLVHKDEITKYRLPLLNIWLTKWSWDLSGKLTVVQAYSRITSILWNRRVQYHVHKVLPFVLSQMNRVNTVPSCFFTPLLIFSPLCPGLPGGLFHSGFFARMLYLFPFSLCLLHILPISFSLIWSF